MKRGAYGAVAALLVLSGCVVVPPSGGVRQPAYYEPQQAYSAPPMEFVEGGAPVYYDNEPGVPFYPIFLDTPGSCFCIVPMRYYNGVWLGLGGVVLHRGQFTFHSPGHQHREAWMRSGGVFNGMRPMRGRVERVGNEMRPIPPQGSVHAQHFTPPPAPPGAEPQRGAYTQQAGQPHQEVDPRQGRRPQQDTPPPAPPGLQPQQGAYTQPAGHPHQEGDPRQGRRPQQDQQPITQGTQQPMTPPSPQQATTPQPPQPQARPQQATAPQPPQPQARPQQATAPQPPQPQARPQQGPAKGQHQERKECTQEEHNEKKC